MKAHMLKQRKNAVEPKPAEPMSEDERPLIALKQGNGINGAGNGRAKVQVNGHHSSGEDEMSEDDAPLVTKVTNGKKRKKSRSPSPVSEDDVPLAASSSPVKQVASAAVPVPQATNGHSKPPAPGGRMNAVSWSDSESDSDDDKPLLSQSTFSQSSATRQHSQSTSAISQTPTPRRPRKKAKTAATVSEDEEESSVESNGASPEATPPASKGVPGSEEENESDGSPVKSKGKGKKAAKVTPPKKTPTAKKEVKWEEPSQETPQKGTKRKGKEKAVKAEGSPRKRAKKEEEEEDVFKWWENPDAATEAVEEGTSATEYKGDGTVKWTTLEHNGVLFPPPYKPLPSSVKFHYDGEPVDLPPESEEIAYFFAKLIGGPHTEDPVFQKNFFRDFTSVLKQFPPEDGTKITDFNKCDFQHMHAYITAEKEKKKSMSKDEKKAEKERITAEEEKYKTCLLDGRKEKVGNFRVEPPGLFLGRGEHPKKGSLKLRLRPEDIVINIAKGAPVPVPNVPGKWRGVAHDNTVTWLANWKENINGNFKYVFLAASSSLKGQSDMNKFEKARELKKHVDRIRLDYSSDLKSKVMADRQRATAMYFIDKLALRAGNEKGEDEADTVGCCSLRCEHVTLDPPNKLVFDFLGKDSIRYYNSVVVDVQVFKNVRIFKSDKDDDDALFDRVSTSLLNKHLQSYMKGLTAKVFRTYNASWTLQEQLDAGVLKSASVAEKLAAYNKANRAVAVLCNHQKTVSKGHGDSMMKMADKLKGLKYDRMKLRHVLFKLDPKMKKREEYEDLESDIDDEFIERWEKSLKERDIDKAKKKFAKENEKLEADGKQPQNEDVLEGYLGAIEEDYARLEKERGTNKAELKRTKPVDKIEQAIEALDTKIKNFKLQMEDKEEGKEVSLGTSKINYLDPRITAAWCAKHDVPISKIFSKLLLQKFQWAMGADADWRF